jgi:phage terminase large subunit-like protein
MLSLILDAIYSKEDTLILLPAGAAKTTWGNTIFLSWLIAMFKDIRVGLFSQTSTFSENFSRAIMSTLENNEHFRELFGDITNGGKWTNAEWLRKGSVVAQSKDLTVFAGGTGGQVASKRFDLLLLDDILGEENTSTIDQKEKVQIWFDKSLYPRLVSSGVCIAFGTRWAPDDLYQTLMTPVEDGGYGFKTIVRQALIMPNDEDESTWSSYWPDVWPVKELIKRRNRNRAMFDCTYQNDVGGLLSGDMWKKGYFQYYGTPTGDPDAELPSAARTKRMGVDLASSIRERADYTARVTSAEDGEGNFYVMRTKRDKIAAGHPEFVVAGYEETPGISLVKIENNQFQSTLVATIVRDYPQMPVSSIRADTDKVVRARAVLEKYQQLKVYHHASLKDGDMEREQLGFSIKGSTHDDLIDAEGYSFDMGGGSFFFGKVKM